MTLPQRGRGVFRFPRVVPTSGNSKKEHLTESGKTLIKTIESNMNSKRYK